jgi:hypothetical protein
VVIGGWSWLDAAVALGTIAYWPIQEWVAHVFLLHMEPFRIFGVRVDPILARNHRNHHLFPSVPALSITPVYIVWFYLATVPVLWVITTPWPQSLTGTAVFFSLVLHYEWIHYLIHSTYRPRSRFYKRLWRNHRLHHFKDAHYWFGVTMLSADKLFGTQPSAAAVPRSNAMQFRTDDDTEHHAGTLPMAGLEKDSPHVEQTRRSAA